MVSIIILGRSSRGSRDILPHKISQRLPIDFDSAPGANLLAEEAPVAILAEKGRRQREIDAAGGAVIDADRTLRIVTFLLIHFKIKAAQIYHVQRAVRITPPSGTVGAARSRIKLVVFTPDG